MITNQKKGSANLIEQTERGEVKQVKEYKESFLLETNNK